MKTMFLSCLSAAACLAVVAPSQSEKVEHEVRVLRMQDPRPGVDIERRLHEVIEMLEADDLSSAQRDRARQRLQELAAQVRKQHARGEVRGKGEGKGEAKGGIVWRAAPADAEIDIDIEVVEMADESGMPQVAPKVRSRVIRVEGMDADTHPEAKARVLRKKVDHVEQESVRLRAALRELEHARAPKAPRAPNAPKPPKPPSAPKPPKDRAEAEWRVLELGGGDGTFRFLERDGDEKVVEVEGLRRGAIAELLKEEAASGRAGRIVARLRELHEADAESADAHEAREQVVRVRKLAEAHRAQREADEAHGARKVLLERKKAAAGERRAQAEDKGAVEVELHDVTEAHELREMLDEMRTEMREIRALMQQIRAQAKADEGVGATGALMRR